MKIGQLMNFDVESCRTDDDLAVAAGKMWRRDIGCLPVVNSGEQVVGMITDRDICMAAYNQRVPLSDISVKTAMSSVVYSCEPTDTVEKAEGIMRTHRVRRLPIVDEEGKLIGIVSLTDIAREVEREVMTKIHEISPQEVTVTLASLCQPRAREM